MPARDLPIHDMASRHDGLTRSIADAWLESARVCLDRYHRPPVDFEIRRSPDVAVVVVNWVMTNARTRNAWANVDDATSLGAYCCVLAALEAMDGLVAVRCAETGTGADYYVSLPGASVLDLEESFRLEVSGVDHGDASAVHRRLRIKLDQLSLGNSSLPAIAGVVGYLARLIVLSYLEG